MINCSYSGDFKQFIIPQFLKRPSKPEKKHYTRKSNVQPQINLVINRYERINTKMKLFSDNAKQQLLNRHKNAPYKSIHNISKYKQYPYTAKQPINLQKQREIKRKDLKDFYTTKVVRYKNEQRSKTAINKYSNSQNYQIIQLLGIGSFSKVMLGKNKRGQQVAIKMYDKRQMLNFSRRTAYYNQIQILQTLEHKNIVSLLDKYDTKTHMCLILSYIEGNSLSSLIKKTGSLPQSLICDIFRQLIQAVAYLHNLKIAHRDIKASNIMISKDRNLFLIDFGLAQQISGIDQKMYCGTPYYMSPQLLLKKGYNAQKADIWACGVVLYLMLTGTHPFISQHPTDLYNKIMKQKIVFPDGINNQAKRICKMLLERNPIQRITSKQILQLNWLR